MDVAGVVTANVPADVPEMVMFFVADAETLPEPSNHSTSTLTIPAVVPVRLTTAVPVPLLVPVAALKVPLPVLEAAIE